MWLNIYSLILLFCISTSTYAQKLVFFAEEISFGIDSVFFTVNGDYYFRNISEESHSFVIRYPVRSNNTAKPIDTIIVFDHDNIVNMLKVDVKDTLATFVLNMPPHSVKKIKVLYRQRHNGNEARYILLTTKFWDKPFEYAEYNLAVRKTISIDEFSIKPDSSVNFGETEIYYWKRQQFMPENDFEIKFHQVGK